PWPGGASFEIGQTQSTTETCTAGYDWVQPTVSSGNTYIVPAAYPVEVISSWSTIANSMGGTMALKVWRQVSGTTYMAIGHDQLRTLSPNLANTFGGLSIPVKPGDFLGLHAG